MKKEKTILVGLNGTSKSFVNAYILKKQGFKVRGFFLDYFQVSNEYTESITKLCDSFAKEIDIEFYHLNVFDEFKEYVLNPCLNDLALNRSNAFRFYKIHFVLKKLDELSWTYKGDLLSIGIFSKFYFYKEENQLNILSNFDPLIDSSHFLGSVSKEILKKTVLTLGDLKNYDLSNILSFFETKITNLKPLKTEYLNSLITDFFSTLPESLTKFIPEERSEAINTESFLIDEIKSYCEAFTKFPQMCLVKIGGATTIYEAHYYPRLHQAILKFDSEVSVSHGDYISIYEKSMKNQRLIFQGRAFL